MPKLAPELDLPTDHEDRLDPIKPIEVPPPPKKDVWTLKRVQEVLKDLGYTLTSWGYYRVTFYRTDTQRTEDGLIPDSDWYDMDRIQFTSFLLQARRSRANS